MVKNEQREELWKEAYKKCRLSLRLIHMAKELGLNPKSLIKNIPNPKQKWKLPVRDWIEEMYAKRFKAKICRKSSLNYVIASRILARQSDAFCRCEKRSL